MKKFVLGLSLLSLAFCSVTANAQTKAYWRFENGVVGTDVQHLTGEGGIANASADIPDLSGNGYGLSAWNTGGDPGYRWVDRTAGDITLTNQASTMSVQHAGNNPGFYTFSEELRSWSPQAFTIELTFKPRNGDHRTYVGRDSFGTNEDTENLAALYVKTNPDQDLAFSYCDVTGVWHTCVTDPGAVQEYIQASDEFGDTIPWYTMVAETDGTTMRIYLLNHDEPELGYQLLKEVANSETENPALTTGAGGAGDWVAGNFTVGRGMWAGGHGDRAYGLIDEVRLSEGCLDVDDFLYSGYQPMATNLTSTQVANTADKIVETTLSWNTAVNVNGTVESSIVDQVMFMSTPEDPNFTYVKSFGDPGATLENTYAMDLDFDSVYKWNIATVLAGEVPSLTLNQSTISDLDPNNVLSIETNVIETLPSMPIILTNPVGTLVNEGEAHSMEVTVDSITTPVFTWYKSDDNVVSEDDVVVGTNDGVLALADITVDDMAYYYCGVVNDSDVAVYSNVALLEVASMVAEFTFDNTLIDTVNGVIGVGFVGENTDVEMTYEEGMVGDAISFNGVDEHVEIPCFVRNSYTIEMWVKTTQAAGGGDWWYGAGLVDGEMPGGVADYGIVLSDNKFAYGSGPSGTTIRSAKVVNDGDWHYCVATRDVVNGDMAIYVDGQLEASATNIDAGVTQAVTDMLSIGKIRSDSRFYNGLIDEVKIYNYAIGEFDVAAKYHAIDPEAKICIQSVKPDTKFDMNNDCIVDVQDLAKIAANWLDCAIYPTCF